ncbi:MAG: hypothetical protein QM610_09420 [Chitinophagaceae bacterium]
MKYYLTVEAWRWNSASTDNVHEMIIVMADDGGVDDIVDILNENVGKRIPVLANG